MERESEKVTERVKRGKRERESNRESEEGKRERESNREGEERARK
jgi:hypothetical protein